MSPHDYPTDEELGLMPECYACGASLGACVCDDEDVLAMMAEEEDE